MQLGGSFTFAEGRKEQVRDFATHTNLTPLVSCPDTLTCAIRVWATHLVGVTLVLESVNMLLIIIVHREQPTSKCVTPWTLDFESLRHVPCLSTDATALKQHVLQCSSSPIWLTHFNSHTVFQFRWTRLTINMTWSWHYTADTGMTD